MPSLRASSIPASHVTFETPTAWQATSQMASKLVPLGTQGMKVPRMGLGTMGMTWAYNPNPLTAVAKAEAVFDALQARGLTFIDTAWIYVSPKLPHSEELVGAAIKKFGRVRRRAVYLCECARIASRCGRRASTIQAS